MLKVKTSSWHYRLWRFGRENPRSKPHNLCKYFWHIALVKILFPLVIATGFLVGVGALLYIIWGHPVDTALILAFVLVAAALIVGLIKLVETLHARQRGRAIARREHPEPPKEPGLVRSMLKARKQQMCPLIKVIDE